MLSTIRKQGFLRAALVAGLATACASPAVLAPAPAARDGGTSTTEAEVTTDLADPLEVAGDPDPELAEDEPGEEAEELAAFSIQAAKVRPTPKPKPTPSIRWPIDGKTSVSVLGIRAGKVFMGTDANPNTSCFDGHRVIDDRGDYTWTIRGTNLGKARGTLELKDADSGKVFDLSVTKWTSTAIDFKPRRAYSTADPWAGMAAVSTAELRIAFPGSGPVVTRRETIVPAIGQRIAGQCTWWAAKRRLDKGFTRIGAYAEHKKIDATYVPRDGDQIMWKLRAGKHAAIIDGQPTSSSKEIKGGQVVTWSIPITQTNTDLRCGSNSFTATWTVETRAKKKPVARGLKFSSGSGDAWGYYR